MASQCYNNLRFFGDPESVSKFCSWIESSSNFGQNLLNLENAGESNEDMVDSLPVESAYPQIDSFCISSDEITWGSRNYPSIISVIELSKLFPKLRFVLDYEQTGGQCKGNIAIIDGAIDNAAIVDYEKSILGMLIEEHNILGLKKGDKIESIGLGMVDVICADVKREDNVINKTFNVIFQCDISPVFVIITDAENNILDVIYSDDSGNASIEENYYHNEMVADLQ